MRTDVAIKVNYAIIMLLLILKVYYAVIILLLLEELHDSSTIDS